MNKAVFLDRDGVINQAVVREGKPYPPQSLNDLIIFPDVPRALALLKNAHFLLIIATNQPDVAKGVQQKQIVEEMHLRLIRELPIDDVKVCYDLDTPESHCYKPKPGMLLEAARQHNIDLTRSYMVGDRWRDVSCGRAAGCFTVFIDRGYAEALREPPHETCGGLLEAAYLILNQKNTQKH